jgi:hypothetical protein
MFLNMVASCCRAVSRSPPNFANEAAGVGLRSASMRSITALMAVSVDESRGIEHWVGNVLTVWLIRAAAALLAYVWKHR